MMKNLQADIVKILLRRRTWNYLRYAHSAAALDFITSRCLLDRIENALVVGVGNGLAEMLHAARYPFIHFTFTDHSAASHSVKAAKKFQQDHNISNVSWAEYDILDESIKENQYDIVYSIEVLEHIKDFRLAAANMVRASRKYVFCLVPFAEETINSNPQKRRRAWEKHQHYVCGFDLKTLSGIFPEIIKASGCYWTESGALFRSKLHTLSDGQINDSISRLVAEAEFDLLRNEIPARQSDAAGIWIVAQKP